MTVQIRVFMSRLRELLGQRPFDGELEVEIHLHVQMLKQRRDASLGTQLC